MIYSDLHMHTVFCDGKNTPEEMVLSAIDKEMDKRIMDGIEAAEIRRQEAARRSEGAA